MSRAQRPRLGVRAAVLLTTGLLVAAAFMTAGCGGQKPPALDVTQVVDFRIFDTHPDGSLAAIVAAYNRAKPADFNTETTPELEAFLDLRDGSIVSLMFSPQFPRDGVFVAVTHAAGSSPVPSVGGAGSSAASTWYKLEAPGLLDAVLALAGDDHGAQVMREHR